MPKEVDRHTNVPALMWNVGCLFIAWDVMANNSRFFIDCSENSRKKIEIAVKYFSAWVQIMAPRCMEMRYQDIYSGKGRYADGTESTPLRILRFAAQSEACKQRLTMTFHERDKDLAISLERNLESTGLLGNFMNPPTVRHVEVDDKLVNSLPDCSCTFTFIDPYGYKGLSARLLEKASNGFGGDCLFFLSFAGVRRNLRIPSQKRALLELLGPDVLLQLEARPYARTDFRSALLDGLLSVVSRSQKRYMVYLGVEFAARKDISHLLVFLSKNQRGFEIMRDIMAKTSLKDSDGIPTWLISEERERIAQEQEGLQLHDGLQRLCRKLSEHFAGRKMLVETVLKEVSESGWLYLDKNIRDALLQLETGGLLEVSADHRKPGKMYPKYEVKFRSL